MPYVAIPTKSTFETDSKAILASRSTDPCLMQIDRLLGCYERAVTDAAKFEVLYYLVWATHFWIKNVDKVPTGAPPRGFDDTSAKQLPKTVKAPGTRRREESIVELSKIAIIKYAEIGATGGGALPWERRRFLLDVGAGSVVGDSHWLTSHPSTVGAGPHVEDIESVYYADKQDSKRYKLRFRKGTAWRWVSPTGANDGFDVFDTTSNRESETGDGLTHFVMGEEGRIYAGFHRSAVWFKHSSFLGGARTAAAGRIKIVKGEVTEVHADSGHYSPSAQHMTNLLMRLELYGQPVTSIVVTRVFPTRASWPATDFLGLGLDGNWPA